MYYLAALFPPEMTYPSLLFTSLKLVSYTVKANGEISTVGK